MNNSEEKAPGVGEKRAETLQVTAFPGKVQEMYIGNNLVKVHTTGLVIRNMNFETMGNKSEDEE